MPWQFFFENHLTAVSQAGYLSYEEKKTFQERKEKSRTRETQNLSTNAHRSTDTKIKHFFGGVKNHILLHSNQLIKTHFSGRNVKF